MESSIQLASREEIGGLITRLLVEELDIDPESITDTATMEELDLDSLDLVEIGQVVEQNYGVRIKASDAEGITDFGGIIQMIHAKLTTGGGDAAEGDENPEDDEKAR